MAKRIGLTMRSSPAPNYDEARDALARGWGDYIQSELPDVIWQPIPNLGKDTVRHVQRWQLDGLILTGGDDLGGSPQRDETETLLLDFAKASELPVFGVCRGLQLLQSHCGGQVRNLGKHVGTRHRVRWIDERLAADAHEFEVNSFHNKGIRRDELAAALLAVAVDPDGWIEAARHRTAPILGVMWHPERERPYRAGDAQLIRRALRLEVSKSEA